MGVQTIVHGRIVLNSNFTDTTLLLQNLQDNEYPFIKSEMFNIGSVEQPFFYENPIVSFGATYKALEYDLALFISKFEAILKNIQFETVKLQIETEFYGDYNLFWIAKTNSKTLEENQYLEEKENWYFGIGIFNRWGLKEENHLNELPNFR